MTEPHDSSQPQSESETDQFAEIRADRACIGCGFNLFGQSVSKEDHYGLAICRCPECGTVAALQSYPAMSHWVNRFRAIIASVWITVLLGFFLGHTMAVTGMAQGAGNLAGQQMSEYIGEANYLWEQAKAEAAQAANPTPASATTTPTIPGLPAGTTIVTNNGVTTINGVIVAQNAQTTSPNQYRWTWLNSEWIDKHLDETIAGRGGLIKNIDMQFLVMFIPGAMVSILFGVFWSITFLGGSRKRVLLVPLVGSIIAIGLMIALSTRDSGSVFASSLTQDLYGPIVGTFFIAVLFLLCAFGIFIGRMVARWIVLMALPPRSRVPLSILWTADNKSLPKP